MTLLEAYQARRCELLAARGFDVSGLSPELMTSADDVFCFPNVVGPIYPGSALLFRVRPHGRDPNRSIKDTWVLEWRAPGDPSADVRRSSRSTRTGTTATGARSPSRTTRTSPTCSRGCARRDGQVRGSNPRQESNILHMHRVIDRYLTNGVAHG